MGPVVDGDERAFATIDPGAGLYVCLTVAPDDKLLRDPILGERIAFEDRADPAVTDDGDAFRVFEKIAEPMSNEKHDPASRGQLVHFSKQLVGFLVRQRRIRFVEQKDLGVAGDRARDLGPLLGCERAVGERHVGETVDARTPS